MDLTLDIRRKIVAAYYGQPCTLWVGENRMKQKGIVDGDVLGEIGTPYFELRVDVFPIERISPEQCKSLVRMVHPGARNCRYDSTDNCIHYEVPDMGGKWYGLYYHLSDSMLAMHADVFRSWGYAIPWGPFSIQRLIGEKIYKVVL